MEPRLAYRPVLEWEKVGNFGSFGIKIQVASDHFDLTTDEKVALNRAAEMIEDAFCAESTRRDPLIKDKVIDERARLVALFQGAVLVDAIPNQYSQSWYYRNLPWYRVATSVGYFDIGWRKRVISISWDRGPEAREIFPEADVTKIGRTIHAWSYEDAREYVARVCAVLGLEE
jgi:hypothetical protein